ncbi:MAG: lipoprotein [Acidovorax sp.]|nr:lipoprotein [Acidovorax sp.]MDH4428604.1 lipoprotein [Acidovorax sp.]MDH4448324.1 lipoprotein [Acidovorax sp.]MDH4463391.1 lipoprotein [Acidovorax sp.]
MKSTRILVRTFILAVGAALVTACGQRGPLYLPSPDEAPQRATLPQTLSLPGTAESPQRRDAPGSTPR